MQLTFNDHATRRLFERQFSAQIVREALENGELIEEYPDDTPFPSRLVIGWHEDRCLHVVASDDPDVGVTVVITVYEPDPSQWELPEFQRRRART